VTGTTVRGRIGLLPNPCTTQPCLPGLALAIEGPAGRHFLTRGRAWVTDPGALAPDLAPGDEVVVTGVEARRTDVHGQPFRTLDVESVERP
jgi:hypothetical protein